MINKIKLFLDFDLTCTYYFNSNEHGCKKDLDLFLEFCVDNFEVHWCSYADYEHIKEELNGFVYEEVIDLIIHEEVLTNSKFEFIVNKCSDSNFIYIDDDISVTDELLFKINNLEENVIKAINKYNDLERIKIELENKLNNKERSR